MTCRKTTLDEINDASVTVRVLAVVTGYSITAIRDVATSLKELGRGGLSVGFQYRRNCRNMCQFRDRRNYFCVLVHAHSRTVQWLYDMATLEQLDPEREEGKVDEALERFFIVS